jgi:hypothetical protein
LKEKLRINPEPTDKALAPSRETISATPNSPNCLEAYSPDRADVKPDCFLADSNLPEEATGLGSTIHSQMKPRGNASLNRTRRSDPKVNHGGTRVTSEPSPHSVDSHSDEMEKEKVLRFTRGNGKPRPGMSGRDFNSRNSDAPNQRKR